MKRTVTCRDGVPLLMDYVEGMLPSRTRGAIDAHVAGCARCQGFVRSYLETPRILRAATAHRLPERFARRLRRTVGTLPPGRRPPARPRSAG